TPPGLNEKKPQVEILEVFCVWGERHSHKKKSGLPKTQVAPSSNTVIKKQSKNQLDGLFGGIVALCWN
uniref:hypothetical protein n=1 Tax=Pasteurella multocida TaxID=747 RepID=UPI002FE2D5DB